MTSPIKLAGRSIDLDIAFPIERGCLISITVRHKDGRVIESFEKILPESIIKQYGPFFPMVAQFLSNITRT